jgi:hypothetical protein
VAGKVGAHLLDIAVAERFAVRQLVSPSSADCGEVAACPSLLDPANSAPADLLNSTGWSMAARLPRSHSLVPSSSYCFSCFTFADLLGMAGSFRRVARPYPSGPHLNTRVWATEIANTDRSWID